MQKIDLLAQAIAPHRQALIQHPVYQQIRTLEDLQLFTQHHVFAVWDFMSLLKSLQIQLTCTQLPWMPVGMPATRYLINEIVTGEESDVDQEGKHISHFELYRCAMQQMGSSSQGIDRFFAAIQAGNSVESALSLAEVPESVAQFVEFTFHTIREMPVAVQAAVFTFGREDLIPDMFIQMVKTLQQNFPGKVDVFRYYIERHIEVDGGSHAFLAQNMTQHLCGADDAMWEIAEKAVIQSLKARKLLWDGIQEAIQMSILTA